MHTTPLYDCYKDYPQMKMTDFGGWDLPVNYELGILAEHAVVRNDCGMFDVSHMGECYVEGINAAQFLDSLVSNDVSKQVVGKAMYAIMCYESGTVVDDLILYKMAEDKFFVVMNASNVEKDLKWIKEHCPSDVRVTDLSDTTCQIAVQGPNAYKYVERILPGVSELCFFGTRYFDIDGNKCVVGRTGYTGEDGFEIYAPVDVSKKLWNQFYEMGVKPCGLGARDTLRLESKLPLYGHEISDTISPLEANLGLFVKLDKQSDFIGKEALTNQQKNGVPRSLRGFEMIDGGVARNGYKVFLNNEEIGYVTSGCKSPSLDKFVGYAMIKRNLDLKFGDSIDIEIHGKLKKAMLVKTPFFKTTKKTS